MIQYNIKFYKIVLKLYLKLMFKYNEKQWNRNCFRNKKLSKMRKIG